MTSSKTALCNKCRSDKPRSEFYADKKRKSGVMNRCKECHKKMVYDRRRLREPKVNNADFDEPLDDLLADLEYLDGEPVDILVGL